MKRNFVSILIFTFFVLTMPFLLIPSFLYGINTYAVDGVMDLTAWNGEKLPLSGGWDFYWKQLIPPEDFNSSNPELTGKQIFKVPYSWNGYEWKGKKLPGNGYATLHLKILLHEPGWYGIKIGEMDTSYSLWINGVLTAKTGEVGTNKQTSSPSWSRKQGYVFIAGRQADIVLQVANFSHRKGGPDDLIYFGKAQKIIDFQIRQVSREVFILGALLMIGIYHLILFIRRRKDFYLLYFSLFCFLIAIRLLLTGEKLFLSAFPFVSWETAVKIEYMGLYLAVPVFIFYIDSLFPKEMNSLWKNSLTWIPVPFILSVLFFPAEIYTNLINLFQVYAGISFIYLIFILIRAAVRKKESAILLLAGLFILFTASIYDILVNNEIFYSGYILPEALLIFFFLQAYLLARHFIIAFGQAEYLSRKLDLANQELDEKIKERTRELEKAVKEMEWSNWEIKNLNENLEKMVKEKIEEIRKKDHILEIQSHQAAMGEMIGNIAHQWRQPLNALGLIIQNARDAFDYGEADEKYIHQMEEKAMELIEHMSSTIDDFRNFFKPNKEQKVFSVAEIIRQTLNIVEAAMKNHGIQIEAQIDESLEAFGYPNEYAQVLLNLLSNAKDALMGSKTRDPKIIIHSLRESGRSVVILRDNAGGIPENSLDRIFEPYFTTKKEGTGIGLYMSKTIIEKNMGGKLSVRNVEGGAEFRIEI